VVDITGYTTMELLEKADGDARRATEWVCRLIGETDKNGKMLLNDVADELMYRFLSCRRNG
jgi:hypothetical protein